jgi:predicted nucleic acid-binding protein
MRVVLDASTTLAAVLPDEHSSFARAAVAAAIDDGLVVPALWVYEVQNGLVMALRRKRLDSTSAEEVLDALRVLQPELEPPRAVGDEYRLAVAHALTSYDAAYLVVAIGKGARIATNDGRLREAAEKIGVPLFAPP